MIILPRFFPPAPRSLPAQSHNEHNGRCMPVFYQTGLNDEQQSAVRARGHREPPHAAFQTLGNARPGSYQRPSAIRLLRSPITWGTQCFWSLRRGRQKKSQSGDTAVNAEHVWFAFSPQILPIGPHTKNKTKKSKTNAQTGYAPKTPLISLPVIVCYPTSSPKTQLSQRSAPIRAALHPLILNNSCRSSIR